MSKGLEIVFIGCLYLNFYVVVSSEILFANGSGDWGSILGRVVSKTQKIVLGASLLNNIITCRSRVSGTIQGKELRLP